MLSIHKNEPTAFEEDLIKEFDGIVQRYPEGRQKSALLPVLHAVQARYGWLSVDAMDQVAAYLHIEPIEVYEVATFYTTFFLRPQGKYVFEICRTGPCCLVGAESIMAYLEKRLGVKENEVTSNGLFSWRGIECIAACGMGPVLQIGPEYTFYENLTEERIDTLINELEAKEKA